MTAVVERKSAGIAGTAGTDSASVAWTEKGPEAGFAGSLNRPFRTVTAPAEDATAQGVPEHCGVQMTSSPGPDASLPWAQFYSGLGEWTCTCGFRQDAVPAVDPLAAVRAASGRLESLQWEMDAAENAFNSAIRSAAAAGAERESLRLAASLTPAELADILR